MIYIQIDSADKNCKKELEKLYHYLKSYGDYKSVVYDYNTDCICLAELSDMIEYHAIADIVDERMPDGKIGKTIPLSELKRRLKKEKDV